MNDIKLTQFSPGAGCGCKISPKDLEEILQSDKNYFQHPDLLVGNDTKDDAAVLKLSEDTAIISTTDFFTPIVDDPFDFGRIAATNAISDIYAMGGQPVMAIAILGWPLDKLSTDIAQKVIDGARAVCENANINLAGGHSIDISDPIFGLAVTGKINPKMIKQNNNARPSSVLFLTKPIGIGILTTAEKRGIVSETHKQLAIDLMTELNISGAEYGKLEYVSAMTDVTGFGLLGHLLEICESSNLLAKLDISKIPVVENIEQYIEQKAIPGGTYRNYKSYGNKIAAISDLQKAVLCDPQTSGGLLIAVDNDHIDDFIAFSKEIGQDIYQIGSLSEKSTENYYAIIE